MSDRIIKFRNGKKFLLTETSIQSIVGIRGDHPSIENDKHEDVYSFISDNPEIVYFQLRKNKFYATSAVNVIGKVKGE
jgi:hypothetical protein